jgi:hypothetical protein
MTIKPITPEEVIKVKAESFPPLVLDAFNELIAKYFFNGKAEFTKNEIVQLIQSKMGLDRTDTIYDNHWLDVEDIYRKAGWGVVYDSPGYCETYEATYTFTAKRNNK